MSFGQFWRINAVIIAVLVAIVSLTRDTDDLAPTMSLTTWLARIVLGDPGSADKIAHFLAYGALGFFTTLGFFTGRQSLAVIIVGIVAYGGALEILQAIGGHRIGDIYDLAANSLGAICGVIGALIIQQLATKLTPPTLKSGQR